MAPSRSATVGEEIDTVRKSGEDVTREALMEKNRRRGRGGEGRGEEEEGVRERRRGRGVGSE